MPTFLMIARHSPENCPMNSEKAKKMAIELMGHIGDLTKKHGLKIVGGWTAMTEHLLIYVFEGTHQGFEKFTMEPAIMKVVATQDSCEIKMVMTLEESMKLLK